MRDALMLQLEKVLLLPAPFVERRPGTSDFFLSHRGHSRVSLSCVKPDSGRGLGFYRADKFHRASSWFSRRKKSGIFPRRP